MYKSTSQAEQFYNRTGSEATKGSRKGFTLLEEGESPLAVLSEQDLFFNEQRAKRAALKKAQDDAQQAKIDMHQNFGKGDPYFAARDKRAKALEDIKTITAELSVMKQARKNHKSTDLNRHFVDWCRDNMPQGQFKAILAIAARKASEAASKGES